MSLFWISQKPNLKIIVLYIEQKKWKSCFCLFTDGRQQKTSKLDMITHECPWHDYCIISSYDIVGTDFKNSLYAFGQSEKSWRVRCIIIRFYRIMHTRNTIYCNLSSFCSRCGYATKGVRSFTVCSIRDWNSLPRSLRVLDSYSRFKTRLFKKFLVTQKKYMHL